MKYYSKIILSISILSFFFHNSHAQWMQQITGISDDFWSISSPSNDICWVSGEGGKVMRTTNGGINWQNVGGDSFGTRTVYNIYAVDANSALVSITLNSNALAFKTTNGGVNWFQVFSQSNGFINSIKMYNNLNGFMAGDPVGGRWSLWKTTNGGVNWDSTGLKLNQTSSEIGWNNGLFVLDNQIWFNTNSNRIYYSSNNGNNWNIQISSPAPNSGNVWFNSSLIGMSNGNNIAYTSDGGNTWVTRNIQINVLTGIMGKGNYFCICEVNAPSKILMTSNAGLNWNIEYQPTIAQLMHITVSRNGYTGWACLTNGVIAKRTSPLNVTTLSNEIPKQFYFSQNYPNPFNSLTKIKFDVSKSSVINISVYDINGRLIEIIANQNFNTGKYEILWNADKYSSGVYFCELKSNSFSQTIKMLLLK